ncbi:MAG: hypothetical protein ACREDR_32865, partial [Blastocatellia bacterium]
MNRLLISSLSVFVYLASTSLAQAPSGRPSPSKPIVWTKPQKYLAGTLSSRRDALKSLHADRGRWIVAYFSVNCGDCDRTARSLNSYASEQRILAVASAPAEEVN